MVGTAPPPTTGPTTGLIHNGLLPTAAPMGTTPNGSDDDGGVVNCAEGIAALSTTPPIGTIPNGPSDRPEGGIAERISPTPNAAFDGRRTPPNPEKSDAIEVLPGQPLILLQHYLPSP